MTYSMTAFAQAKTSSDAGELSCELRSVNHRFLEIAPRMPDELRPFEGDLRELIGSKLARGRVDCFLRFNGAQSEALSIDTELVKSLEALQLQVQHHAPSVAPLRAIDVLRWPNVLVSADVEPDDLKALLLETVKQALDSLLSAREREGAKMAELIVARVTQIQNIVGDVRVLMPELATAQRQKLEERLAEFKEQLDPQRIEQEMTLLLNKTDVAEELDRLDVHLQEIVRVLNKPKPAGRRLDFLMQELNREANTLGSKSNDARTTKASVDIKVLIEQMREQVQNIE